MKLFNFNKISEKLKDGKVYLEYLCFILIKG